MKTTVIVLSTGIISGFVNGFFGTGGGLIIFGALTYLGCDTRRALASANFGVMILSVSSFLLYLKTGTVSFETLFDFAKNELLTAVIAGGFGAWLSGKISAKWLKKIFSFLVAVCGVRMITA